jgi:hypothetical protein
MTLDQAAEYTKYHGGILYHATVGPGDGFYLLSRYVFAERVGIQHAVLGFRLGPLLKNELSVEKSLKHLKYIFEQRCQHHDIVV